jgi:hypothetical protein
VRQVAAQAFVDQIDRDLAILQDHCPTGLDGGVHLDARKGRLVLFDQPAQDVVQRHLPILSQRDAVMRSR